MSIVATVPPARGLKGCEAVPLDSDSFRRFVKALCDRTPGHCPESRRRLWNPDRRGLADVFAFGEAYRDDDGPRAIVSYPSPDTTASLDGPPLGILRDLERIGARLLIRTRPAGHPGRMLLVVSLRTKPRKPMSNAPIEAIPTDSPRNLSVKEAARRIGISNKTLRKMIDRGDVTHVQLPGQPVRIPSEVIDRMLADSYRPARV